MDVVSGIACTRGRIVVVVTLGFAAGDDGLQEQMVACIHVGNKKHVAVDLDNQNPLA